MKKTLNILKHILVWTLVLIAVFMMIFTIISVRTFDRNDRSLFGYKAYTVLSDSMSATDFDAGAIVFVKEVEDPATLKPGDIISFLSQDPENKGGVITHKIRRLALRDNEPVFITYGTTNNVDDEHPVSYPYVMGKYEFHIPFIGHFFEFIKTTPGYVICIFLPFALLMLYNGINCVRLFRRYRKEQYAELEDEKKKIAEEREENAKVLAELRALKQQMESGIVSAPAAAPVADADVPKAESMVAEPKKEINTEPASDTAAEPKAPESGRTRRVRSVPKDLSEDISVNETETASEKAAEPEADAAVTSIKTDTEPKTEKETAPESIPTQTTSSHSDAPALRRPRVRRR